MEKQSGVWVGNVSCSECSSQDNLSLYQKEDEDGETFHDGHCQTPDCGFKGRQWVEENVDLDNIDKTVSKRKRRVGMELTDEDVAKIQDVLKKGTHGWRERKISKTTHSFYGVKTDLDDEGAVKMQYYPSTSAGKLVGFHVRNDRVKQLNKQAKIDGTPKVKGIPFFPIGICTTECELFGQSLFARGGRKLVITAGEVDAMAVYQTLKTDEYETPVISPTIGEGNAYKQVQHNLEYIMSFEKVIICFDNDDTGIAGAEAIASLLKPSQAFIVELKGGDPCEYLAKGKVKALRNAVLWCDNQYSPVGVYSLSSMWDSFANSSSGEIIPFPRAYSTLNKMMGGGRERGEITCFGAYTSIGKSTIIAHNVYELIKYTKFKVGVCFLESTMRETVRDLLSIDIKQNLRRKSVEEMDMEELRQSFFNGVGASDQMVFVDAGGGMPLDEAFDKFRYLISGCGCDLLIIDPIQALIASDDNGVTINFMDRLLKLAKGKNNPAIDIVSHMRKPNSEDPHHVTEYDLLGSSSINQISFNTVLASRDKMATNPKEKNWTGLHLVKCRRTGNTGKAGGFEYDPETSLIKAAPSPYGDEDCEVNDKELFGDVVEDKVVQTSPLKVQLDENGDEVYFEQDGSEYVEDDKPPFDIDDWEIED